MYTNELYFCDNKIPYFFLFTIYFFRIYMLSNLLYCLYRPWSLVEQYCIPYFHFYNSVVCWRLSTIIEQNIHVSIHRLFISQRIKKFIKFFSIMFWWLITVGISDIFFSRGTPASLYTDVISESPFRICSLA